MGGFFDNAQAGAAWVYTRSGTLWTQQGGKLVGTGAVGKALQGQSVALSADGNTAMVGGVGDNSFAGAAWVYTRSNGVWTEQGGKLVGTSVVGAAFQGTSVALSADGNTAIVGGPFDNAFAGATWVYTRSNGVWTQQGSKLIGAGAVGAAIQGTSVALSADGDTAIVGGPSDAANAGATWVYTRSNGVWTQQPFKLVADSAIGAARQGVSVALSADGNTAIVGGLQDNSNAGAAWLFVQPTVPFSAFNAKLTINARQHRFALQSSFTLGGTSNGINPVIDEVTLQIGTFIAALPPGSFNMTKHGDYAFAGVIDDATLKVQINLSGSNRYSLSVAAQNAGLTKTTNPVTVSLAIGDNTGQTKTVPY